MSDCVKVTIFIDLSSPLQRVLVSSVAEAVHLADPSAFVFSNYDPGSDGTGSKVCTIPAGAAPEQYVGVHFMYVPFTMFWSPAFAPVRGFVRRRALAPSFFVITAHSDLLPLTDALTNFSSDVDSFETAWSSWITTTAPTYIREYVAEVTNAFLHPYRLAEDARGDVSPGRYSVKCGTLYPLLLHLIKAQSHMAAHWRTVLQSLSFGAAGLPAYLEDWYYATITTSTDLTPVVYAVAAAEFTKGNMITPTAVPDLRQYYSLLDGESSVSQDGFFNRFAATWAVSVSRAHEQYVGKPLFCYYATILSPMTVDAGNLHHVQATVEGIASLSIPPPAPEPYASVILTPEQLALLRDHKLAGQRSITEWFDQPFLVTALTLDVVCPDGTTITGTASNFPRSTNSYTGRVTPDFINFLNAPMDLGGVPLITPIDFVFASAPAKGAHLMFIQDA